jgi:hypothetical protein
MRHSILTLAVLGVLLSACASLPRESSAVASPQPPIEIGPPAASSADAPLATDEGDTFVDGPLAGSALDPVSPGELSSVEADALRYMREEEKLAHDVYLVLYEQWHLPIFQNIANSEQVHTGTVAALLDRYGLDDPATPDVGSFADPYLQELYDQLVAQGGQSLVDALKVGATIEEVDILDLEQRIAQTDNLDIVRVYENLMQGSGNHLRAFVATLATRTDQTYQPQYLSQEAYRAILTDTTGRSGRVWQVESRAGRYGRP